MTKLALLPLVLALAAPLRAQTLEQLSDADVLRESLQSMPAAALPAPAAVPAPAAAAQGPQLPRHFRIDEKVLSWTTSFTLRDDAKNKLGEISEKLLSWTRTFTYRDASGTLLAVAHAKLLSWGTQVVVEDASGRLLGTIKENVLKSLFKVYTRYSILDASGREVAVSEKTDWITTDFEIRDESGRLVAKMHRPWLNILSDHWDVQLADARPVDSRVLVMIAAYKTAVDNQRRAQQANKDHDDK